MGFRMTSSTVAVQADIKVSALLALKPICLNGIHVALITSNVFMHIVLKL